MSSKPNFYKNVYFLLKGNVLFQIITILALMLITRLYTANQVGTYVVFLSISTILGNISTGRLELALMIPKNKKETENIFLTGIKLSFFVSLISLFVICFLFLVQLSNIVYFLLPLTILILGHTLLQAQILNKLEKFNYVGNGKVLFGLITSILQIGLYYIFENNVFILILGYLLGLLSMNIFYWCHLRNEISKKIISKKLFKETLYKNKSFPLLNNTGSLFNLLANQGPVILIESFFGAAAAAFYSVVQKTLNAPSSLLSRAFSDVFFKKVTDVNYNPKEIKGFVKQNLKYFIILIILAVFVIFTFGDILYTKLFGNAYIESAVIAKITILFFMIRFVVTSLNSIVIAKGWLKSDLKFNVLLFFSQILPILIGYYIFDFNLYTTISLMTLLGVLSYMYLGLLVYFGINDKDN